MPVIRPRAAGGDARMKDGKALTGSRPDRDGANDEELARTKKDATKVRRIPNAFAAGSCFGMICLAAAAPAPSFAQRGGLESANAVLGVSPNEIRFGASVPFTGPNKVYSQKIRVGLETAFRAANDAGGVYGRSLRWLAADDGYEPARTAETVTQLHDEGQVFGFVGNFGAVTAAVSVPYAIERRMLFYAPYTGAPLTRRDPPDHYVFNYRPSYAEETEAAVKYLVRVRQLNPEQIAVFAEQDAFGDAGSQGAAKALQLLGRGDGSLLRLGYARNSIDIDSAIDQLKAQKTPIQAVVMVATYRAASSFIEKTKDAYPGLTYTNVSAVGADFLRDELMLLGSRYAAGVVVTQVVPAVDGDAALAIEYKHALTKYFSGEPADATSFEYFIAGKILIEALKRAGPHPDIEKVVDAFESIRDYDIGLGAKINFGPSEHQALHKVWGAQLNEEGKYETIDLQ